MRFHDWTVAITGASRGLGRHLALAFAREGAFVAVGYRARREEAELTLQACEQAGGAGTLLGADVRDRDALRDAFAELARQRGSIDVLVNNAAVQHDGPFVVGRAEEWDEVIGVNLTGVANCTHAVARAMMARRRGVIVNVASAAALRTTEGRTSYTASKAAVLAFTRVTARELAPHGVRVNALVPGFVDAGMAERMDHRLKESSRTAIPLGRFADATEIAAAALFLASDDASYLIGHALVVDGGVSL